MSTDASIVLLAHDPNPDDETIRDWLGGNLCRCTGYRQIVDADTDDLTTLNMLGDLHARAGEDDEALGVPGEEGGVERHRVARTRAMRFGQEAATPRPTR